jgi:integrase
MDRSQSTCVRPSKRSSQKLGCSSVPRLGKTRTLYSLRHTYATFALVNDGMDIHALAKQMGTSIGMIERHYSHLTPRMKKDMFTGKRYELSAEEYAEQKAAGDS